MRAMSFFLLLAVLSMSMSASAQQSSADAGVPTVAIVKPLIKPLGRVLELSADVRAYQQAEIHAKASGYVKAVNVEIGDAVAKDAILAELSVPEMIQEVRIAEAEHQRAGAALTKAEAVLRRQEKNHRRAAKLAAEKVFTETQLEEALAAYESASAEQAGAEAEVTLAEAKWKRLQELAKYATLRAPFAGVVTERMIDAGDFVRSAENSTSGPLFIVVAMDRLRVQLAVPESEAALVKAGETEVTLTFKALSRREVKSRVTRIAASLASKSRTMLTEVEIDNPGRAILPGMYAIALLQLDKERDALVIPAAAVHSDGETAFVWLAEGDQVVRREITVGLDDGETTEVMKGLDLNAAVIKSAPGALSEGMKIRPLPEK